MKIKNIWFFTKIFGIGGNKAEQIICSLGLTKIFV